MTFSIATWNINSVRLRAGLVEQFLGKWQPDILCLQEIKCQNDQFPEKNFRKLGYEHVAVHGQKGYHGVATLSRLPLEKATRKNWCGKEDARHALRITAGGTEYSQGLTVIIDDCDGNLRLNPSKTQVTFSEEAHGQTHEKNLYAWLSVAARLYYDYCKDTFCAYGKEKSQLTEMILEMIVIRVKKKLIQQVVS